jgi:flavin reductase
MSLETLTPAVEKTAFRDAMSRLGAAVNIITTEGPAGRAGFTASAVCSVTDSPPTLLVCLNRSASVYPVFRENMQLCVNTLAAGHETLSSLFGGKTPMADRFIAAEWSTAVTGSPVLSVASHRLSVLARMTRCSVRSQELCVMTTPTAWPGLTGDTIP